MKDTLPPSASLRERYKISSDADKKKGSLNYVITGSGRSGTTFLANCFLEASYDLGGVTPANIGKGPRVKGGGLEHPLFKQINNYIRDLMTEDKSYEYMANKLGNLMNTRWPQVLKDPRFSYSLDVWGAAGYLPKHVFLCIRDPEETIGSMRNVFDWVQEGTRYDFYWQYKTIAYCIKNDIPITYVLFPRIGKDKDYANKTLSPFINNEEPWEIIKRIWDENMVLYEIEKLKDKS